MSKNKQQDPQQTLKVENYEFEPIKGYPMLNWKGKRPFTSTQYFPAQLKESYGKPDANGWMNKIFWGDNLQVMSHLLKEYRGRIKLVYIDPPFDSKADYKKKIQIKGQSLSGEQSAFEEKQYRDIWSNDEYLQFMYDRIVLIKELLADDGAFYLHCDWHNGHYLKIICDEIFGREMFRSEIIWKRTTGHSDANHFGAVHDTIFFYTKTDRHKLNQIFTKYDEEYVEQYYRFKEPDGRRFMSDNLTGAGDGPSRDFGKRGVIKPPVGRHWMFDQKGIDKLIAENRIYWTKNGIPRLKKFLDEAPGMPLNDMWDDIQAIRSWHVEASAYPTQKPEELAARIITASSNEGDIVFDCFLGSGTTAIAAAKINRKFIGADINSGAIYTAFKRLQSVDKLKNVGFELLNVNNYDLFRNPIEAKELIVSLLEVEPFRNSLFDGAKDGRMVKIMPVNRIASKGDLSDLIAGLDYKSFEKRQKESPNKAVEKILLVCMGHEPDLKAHLEKEVKYKLDVEIVDILRDKQDLQFKRESEAKIKIKKDKLVIEKFYPMNLLQKLSLQKEKVTDWKELVESVLIDWNYDGAVLEPQVIDIPEKNELVAGEYDVPKDVGTIRVKITDLLSESIEIEVGRE